jgi:hypothetical protein
MIGKLFKHIINKISNIKTKLLSFVGGSSGDAFDKKDFEKRLRADLNRCLAKNPSVIKRKDWEMYHNKVGNIYVYFLKSRRRVIYRR